MTNKKTQKKKTNQEHQCTDSCVRHGDCGCDKCTHDCNGDKDSYGRILPVSKRILGHILSVDAEGLENILHILDDASGELLMGHRYLESLSKEMPPFTKPDLKLIEILKQMQSDIDRCQTQCEDAISDYITIMQDVEDMKKDGKVWKEIAERYLGEDSEEEEEDSDDNDDDSDDDNEEE